MSIAFVMGVVFLVYIVINIILIKKSREFNKSREFVKFMFLVYFFGVLTYTINPGYLGSGFGNVNYIPFVETLKMFNGEGTSMALHQVVGNLIMLAPLAMFLAALYKKCNNILKIAGMTFMCSLIIEVNQFFTGRFADVDDLIINTLGGVLGYLVYKLLVNVIKKIKLFRVILDNSANDKSAVKGLLVVIIPTLILIQGGYHLGNYLYIKNNSVDINTIASEIENSGRKVLLEKKTEWGEMIYVSTDNKGGYYGNSYYEEEGNYFPNGERKINDDQEDTNYLYKDDKGNFIVSNNMYGDSAENLEGGHLYIKAPIGSTVIFSNGDKKVSVKVDKEILYENIELWALELKYEEQDKIKIEIKK